MKLFNKYICMCWLYGANINHLLLSHSLTNQAPAQARKLVADVYWLSLSHNVSVGTR